MKKQICIRLDQKTFEDFKKKLRIESKSATLFFLNMIHKYINDKIKEN